ncbi:choice-of-anchor D domain-containing protein [Terriglobus roseus]|nr:choice-of-anchor D domain-containing protein [Terriglobus roseus]
MIAKVGPTELQIALPSAKGKSELLSVQLGNASAKAESTVSEKQNGDANYLIGNTSEWRTHVSRYGRLTYANVYSGIDLTYYGNGSRLEHDFIVQPGADPATIDMRFRGSREVRVLSNGDLLLSLDKSVVTLHKPLAYQSRHGIRSDIPVQFALSGNNVRFTVGSYDHSQPLVIDPVLDYSTFLGDASIYVNALALDSTGNTYIIGEAPSTFPGSTSTPACVTCMVGTNKLTPFITKLNTTGSVALYTTFFGGSISAYNSQNNDAPMALVIDANGNAIITGTTDAKDFPMKNPIAAGVPSLFDGFLLSLTADGSALNFSSRLGGSSSASQGATVYPQAVTTNAQGDVFVTGTSESPFLPVTSGAVQAFVPSYTHTGIFLLKLSSTGTLGFGALLGASGSASGGVGIAGIAVDSSGLIYIAGTVGSTYTDSANFTPWPTTANAYQTQLISPSQNAPFVARIAADGSKILSSTLVGTGKAGAMTLTSDNNVLLTGSPNYNFPVTTDAYASNSPTQSAGGASAFFAKVSGDGSQLLYSSMYGPTSTTTTMSGIAQDASGNVWIAGTTYYGNISTTTPALQSVLTSTYGPTGFVARFDSSLHNQNFASYVNDTVGSSQLRGIALDADGHAHVSGIASQTFPTTDGAAVRTVTAPPPNYTYNYGFAARIDADSPGPAVCFANASRPVVQVGQTGNGTLDIVNCGNAQLNVSSVSVQPAMFALTSASTCPATLAAGASCSVKYTVTPTTAGIFSGTISFATNAPMGGTQHLISGTATVPQVYVPSPYISFQPAVVGTAAQLGGGFVLNRGTAPLVIDTTRTTLTGAFTLTTTTCDKPVAINGLCSYTVSFTPTTAGTFTGALTLYTNDPQTPTVTFTLSATAVDQYPAPTLTGMSSGSISLDGGIAILALYGSNFFPTTQLYVNGQSVAITQQSSTTLQFKLDPAALGSLGEFPVQVVNPAPGGASNTLSLTTFHVVPLTHSNMVYDPKSQKIFAAIPNLSTTNPNTIVPIDPTTGTAGTPIPVLKNPARLALSDDGHYLYVSPFQLYGVTGQLQRIDLTTGMVDRTFTLPGSSTGIQDMHAVPGYPELLVATLVINGSPSENGLALFNDSGLVEYHSVGFGSSAWSLDSFQFVGQTLYALSGSNFTNYAVFPTGFVSLNPSFCCTGTTGYSMATDGSLLYTSSGQVWDPRASKLLGTYSSSSTSTTIYADPSIKRTFFLASGLPDVSAPAVVSFDSSTFQRVGYVSFPSMGSEAYWLVHSIGDYFAFGNNLTGSSSGDPAYATNLILFRSSMGTPGTPIGPTILSTSPANLPATSPATTITLTGSGFDADAVVSWNGSPRVTTYTSATSLQVQLTADDLNTASIGKLSVKNAGTGLTGANFNFQVIGAPITFSPASLTFPVQAVNSTSTQQAITLTNTSGADIHDLTLAVTGTDATLFKQANNCLTTLVSGASCTASVTFTSSSTGTKSASLIVNQAGVALPVSAALSGSGSTPAFTLSRSTPDFGVVGVGLLKQIVATYVTNSGDIPLSGLKAVVSGTNSADFPGSVDCFTDTLPVGSQCYVIVTFSPQAVGSRTATLTISANGAVSQQLTLTGTGARIGVGVSNSTFTYGDIVVGASGSATTTFTNTGDITLDQLGVRFDSTDLALGQFQFSTDCGQASGSWTLAPGKSCTFTLALAPTRLGAISNALVFGVLQGDGSMPAILAPARQRITYTANGIDAFSLEGTSVDFGSIIAGQTSSEKTISLTNADGFAFGLNGTLSGTNASEFSYSNDCPASIATATRCTLHLKFNPASTGTKTAILTLVPQRSATQGTFPYGYVAPLSRVVTLTGTGGDFSISGGAGGSAGTPAATVTAGQPAAYSFSVSQSVGSQDTVTMSCGNLPQYATCTFDPPSFTLGSALTVVNLSISTQQTVTSNVVSFNGLRGAVSLALLSGWGLWAAARRRSGFTGALRVVLALLSVGLMFTAGCSGSGSGSSSNGGSSGGGTGGGGTGGSGGGGTGGGTTVNMTPAGTYSIAVTATTGSISRSQNVTLTVK